MSDRGYKGESLRIEAMAICDNAWNDSHSTCNMKEHAMNIKAVLSGKIMAFSFIKATLDRDAESYEAICERNRENGLKGGRPQKPKKPSGFPENPEEPKKPDIDTDTDTERDIEKKEKEKERE